MGSGGKNNMDLVLIYGLLTWSFNHLPGRRVFKSPWVITIPQHSKEAVGVGGRSHLWEDRSS